MPLTGFLVATHGIGTRKQQHQKTHLRKEDLRLGLEPISMAGYHPYSWHFLCVILLHDDIFSSRHHYLGQHPNSTEIDLLPYILHSGKLSRINVINRPVPHATSKISKGS